MLNASVTAAAHTAPDIPTWSTTLLVLAALWWLGFLVAAIRTKELRVERRLYWFGYGGVAPLVGVAMCYTGWRTGLGAAGFVVVMTLMYAAIKTPYLKIGDRLITASDSDRRRDERDRGIAPRPASREDYTTTTPRKMWWSLTFFAVMSAVSVLLPDDGDWRAWIAPVMVLFVAPFVGALDGRGRFPVARRQWVQATLAAVASLALYGAPIVLYAIGYLVGRRLPVSYGRHDADAPREHHVGEAIR